jgi:translation initiation factor 1
VRREKKGRGGKTVTRVTGLGPAGADLPQLARELKRALGCGASVDGTDVLLQGSMTERAAAWLEERFEVPVSIGN